jgi:hypothetical protein
MPALQEAIASSVEARFGQMRPKAAVSFTEELKLAIALLKCCEYATPRQMTTAGNDAIAITQLHRLEVSTSAADRIDHALLLNIGLC